MRAKDRVLSDEQQRLVEDCWKLALYLARMFWKKSGGLFPIEEAKNAAYDGLVRAAFGYKPGLGAFAPYASVTMRYEIKAARRRYIDERAKGPASLVAFESTPGGQMATAVLDIDLDTKIMLEQAISRLSPEQASVVTLHREGYTFDEIGRARGYTRQNACMIYRKALQDMRQMMSLEDIA